MTSGWVSMAITTTFSRSGKGQRTDVDRAHPDDNDSVESMSARPAEPGYCLQCVCRLRQQSDVDMVLSDWQVA